MTVQTQARPAGIQLERRKVRGLRAFVVGIAALATAGMGIGIGFAVTGGGERPAVVAPDSPAGAALQRLHAEGYPEAQQRVEGLQRLHADGYTGIENTPSFTDAFARLKDEGWTK